MTLTQLLEKLKSNDSRDALADAYTWPNWPKKSDHDRSERYSTMMYYEIGYAVNEAFEEGYNARTKDLELVIKIALKAIEQRDKHIDFHSCQDSWVLKERDNKELEAILKERE